MRATNSNASLTTGLLADLPDPRGVPGGSLYWAYDAQVCLVCERNPLSPSSAAWRTTTGATGAAVPVARYVDPAGDPAASGLRAGAPTTLAAALAQATPGAPLVVVPNAGTYVAPTSLALPWGSTVLLAGVYAPQLGGVQTVGVGSTTTRVVNAQATMTPSAQRGDRLRMLSGATAGQLGTVRANTSASLAFFGTLSAAPQPGDTFVVERAAVSLTWPSLVNWDLSGALLLIDAVAFTWSSASRWQWLGRAGEVRMRGCRLDKGPWYQPMYWVGTTGTLGSLLPAPAQIQNNGGGTATLEHGCYITGATPTYVSPNHNARLYAQDLVVDNTQISIAQAYCEIAGYDGVGAPIDAQQRAVLQLYNAPDGQASSLAGAFPGFDAITVEDGSDGYVSATVVTGWTGNAVTVTTGSTCAVTGVTGTGSTGHGLAVARASRVHNLGSNTVAGADQVQLGGNAAVAWSSLPAYQDDHAAASPQGCAIYT